MPSTTSSASGGGIFARVARRLRYKSRKETVSKASETQLTSLSQATSTSRGGGASTLTSSRECVEVREQRVTVKQFVKLASRQTSSNSDDTHTECLICLDSIQDGKTTISMGCACRGDAGFGHVGCKIAAAMHSGIDCSKAWQSKLDCAIIAIIHLLLLTTFVFWACLYSVSQWKCQDIMGKAQCYIVCTCTALVFVTDSVAVSWCVCVVCHSVFTNVFACVRVCVCACA